MSPGRISRLLRSLLLGAALGAAIAPAGARALSEPPRVERCLREVARAPDPGRPAPRREPRAPAAPRLDRCAPPRGSGLAPARPAPPSLPRFLAHRALLR